MSPSSWQWLQGVATSAGQSAPLIRSVLAGVFLMGALLLCLPAGMADTVRRRALAICCGIVGLALLWWTVPSVGVLGYQTAFWLFAAITILAAAATVSSRKPVYCAIWFAITLLGTAALLLLQGAQFLSVATVAVYAGAIVVTFLFVLMLAQPAGQAFYDRIGWGTTPRFVGSLTAVLFAILISAAITKTDSTAMDQQQMLLTDVQSRTAAIVPDSQLRSIRIEETDRGRLARMVVSVPFDQRNAFDSALQQLQEAGLAAVREKHPSWQVEGVVFQVEDLSTPDHTAELGRRLFTQQLIAVQVAGTLLLAALVGAVAIASRPTEPNKVS